MTGSPHDAIRQACPVLFEPGQVTELRAFNVPTGRGYTSTLTGYFDDPDALAAAAAQIDAAGAEGVYVVLNPVLPDLLARAANRTVRAKRNEATKNEDVTARRWFFLDFDPVRPSGISSTDAEHAAALARAEACRAWLTGRGWPAPVFADSGNGAHLLYRVELPADDGGLTQRCLAALAARYSDDEVGVDLSVHNAARLCKLHGTTARKGDATEARPHRRSALLDVPDGLVPVPRRLLEALAALAPTNGTAARSEGPRRSGDRWEAETVREALAYVPPRPRYQDDPGGGGWINVITAVYDAVGDKAEAAALLNEWSPEERPGEYLEKLETPLDRVTAGTLVYLAKQGGWVPPWEHGRGGRSERRTATRNGAAERAAVEAAVARSGLGVVLSGVKRERVSWLWKGRLAAGKLTILDGDPGTGKSVFYIDCAARVTTGAAWSDEEVPPPGREAAGVVIVTTEDGIADTIAPRAAIAGADLSRISVVQLIPEEDGPGRVPVLPDDVELIMGECERIGARLLVIDPLMAHLGGDTNSYKDSDVRRALAPLAEAAERYGVAVLVVRHLNKAPGGNPLYRGGGSIGIIGAARIGLMLGRDPDQPERLALACTKINVGAEPGSLALSVEPSAEDPELPVIAWHGRSPFTARDLCANPDRGESKTEAAEAWLLDVLDSGPRPSSELIEEGKAAGFSRRTLFRAKDALGVEAKKLGFAGGWEWMLPEGVNVGSVPKGANPTDGTLGDTWHPSAAGDGVPGVAVSLTLTAPCAEQGSVGTGSPGRLAKRDV